MSRFAFHVSLATIIGAVALNTAVVGQDKVERKGQKQAVSGKIVEEKLDGIKMKIGAKEELIPSTDIIRIYYDDVPAAAKQSNLTLFVGDEKDLKKALKDHTDLLEKAKTGPPGFRRYLEYRIATLQAATAEDDVAREGAMKSLTNFTTAHAASWEYPFAARALAKMQLAKPDYDAALKTIEPLTKSALVPAAIKTEAEFMLIDVLFQAKRIDEVKTKIAAAMTAPTTSDAQKARYAVYLVGVESQAPDAKLESVVKKLEEIIAKPTTDNSIKALAYNVMGDCYMQKNRKRDAMWSYLWVDVVYSQDHVEHVKAMSNLVKIFDDENDKEKAQLYRDKLSRLK
jgi:predicted negative regulator of RcsB-dependent stress response